MKKALTLLFLICCLVKANCQEKSTKEKLLTELSSIACKCVDSIDAVSNSNEEITKLVSKCITKVTGAYQLGLKLADIESLKKTSTEKDGKKQINISLNNNQNSDEYKDAYHDIEKYMAANCPSVRSKLSVNNKQNNKSFSENKEALDAYSKGVDELKKDNYKDALNYFSKAVKSDPEFVFAWDNLGLCYRRTGDYDKALEVYKRSLQIDPNGVTPLQNIAVVYQSKKLYDEAIKAYEKLSTLDKGNAEVYFGLGQAYASKGDFEKGLDNICKAYNLYDAGKSPYRSDAEQIIQMLYAEMKKQGKEDKFKEILKANNITPK